jgi:GNAT superfamily N-acetyltransferase
MSLPRGRESGGRLALPVDAVRRIGRADAGGLYRMATFIGTLVPGLPARLERPGEAWLVVMGPGQLVNRVSGLGLEGPVTPATLHEVERMFEEAGLEASVEVWPGADPALQVLLEGRGYRPGATLRVLAAVPAVVAASGPGAGAPGVALQRVTAALAEVYERTVSRGFMDMDEGEPELAERIFARGAARSPEAFAWLAEIDGEPAGGGAMAITGGIAALFGASTLPRFRSRGVQRALLDERLRAARDAGSDLAFLKTAPDSGSERNARRAGFEVVGEPTMWTLGRGA